LRVKFDRLMQGTSAGLASDLFDQLMSLEQISSVDQIALA
jgi:hypothetical protein